MRNRLFVIGLLAALALGAGAAEAEWGWYFAYNRFAADVDGEQHPKDAQLKVAANLLEGHFGVLACACYVGTFTKPQKGKVIVEGEVALADGSREEFRLKMRVRKSSGDNCEFFGQLDPEGVISVNYEFKGFGDLQREVEENPDRFLVGWLVLGHMSGPEPTRRQARRLLRGQIARDFAGVVP